MSKSYEYSKTKISGGGVMSVKSNVLVRSNAARHQISALKNVKLTSSKKKRRKK